MDEEIDSDLGDDIDMEEQNQDKKGKSIQNDPFF